MASLYERLMGAHPDRPKIPVHQFQSIAAEWARGNLTGPQALAYVEQLSGVTLDATEQAEAQDLVATVTAIPSGTAAGLAQRALRIQEIDQVLLLAETRIAPYDTPAAVRARLGVPTR
jgi:lysozyme family protein